MPIPCAFLTISSRRDSRDVKVTCGSNVISCLSRGVIGIQLARISPAVQVIFVGRPITEAVREVRSEIENNF